MSNYRASVWKVNNGGPYAYTIEVDGIVTDIFTGVETWMTALTDAETAINGAIPDQEFLLHAELRANTAPNQL